MHHQQRRWSPVDDMLEIQKDLRRTFGRFFPTAVTERRPVEMEWAPDIDVFVRGKDMIVRADISGIDPKNVDITVAEDTLTLRGERKADREINEEDYYSSEISYGSFERNIRIPRGIDTETIDATYKNGILEIVVPGAAEKEQPRKININVSAA